MAKSLSDSDLTVYKQFLLCKCFFFPEAVFPDSITLNCSAYVQPVT
jgi:hypothetical protein